MPPPNVQGSLRRRALDAAQGLLEEQGADALTLRMIATNIDCGVASLYYYFSGKDALLGALALEGFHHLARTMSDVVARKEFVRDIDSVSAGYLRFMSQNLQLYALMYSERILTSNEAVREAEAQILSILQAALEDDPRIPGDKREEAAFAYSAFGRGVASVLLSQGRDDLATMRHLRQKIVSGFGVLLSTEFPLRRPADSSEA